MPYRIALVSKYPPLEGGIAARTYWLARGLAARGYKVHVITDGLEAGGEYCIQGAVDDPSAPGNLFVHRGPGNIPWHLPESNESALALLDLTVKTIRDHSIQVLDTGYLVPYGIVGSLAKRLVGIPHIMRHGGSDIEKFLKAHILETMLREAITGADRVLTTTQYRSLFESLASDIILQPAYVPDESVFLPAAVPHPQFRLAVIGKINYYWQQKNLLSIVNIMHRLVGQFECCIIGQGKGLGDFQRDIGPCIKDGVKLLPFVPPWEMPALLAGLSAIFIFESGLPHPVISNLAMEAVMCGVGIITNRADFANTYSEIFNLDSNQVLVLASSEASAAADQINKWIKKRSIKSTKPLISYQEYLLANEALYFNVLQ